MGNSQINAFHEPSLHTPISKVKEMLCGIFRFWYLAWDKSFWGNKTEIFELKIVSRSQRHVLQNFPEFEFCFICNIVPAKFTLSDLSSYDGHFDALFILAPFDFLLSAPSAVLAQPLLNSYPLILLWVEIFTRTQRDRLNSTQSGFFYQNLLRWW